MDVTAYITGNGTHNLAYSTTSTTNVSYSSREGVNAPQLVIETGGTPSGPTNTPTPGPSPTPSNTPAGLTQTPTRTPTPSRTPTTPSQLFSNATFCMPVLSAVEGTVMGRESSPSGEG